jgi:hypothetical protein
MRTRRSLFSCGLVTVILAGGWAVHGAEDVPLPPGVTKVPYDPSAFRPDPDYGEESYNADAQLKIYGDKRAVPVMRPLLELGREMYREGPFQPGVNVVGKKNLVFANLLASGDWRGAVAYNDTGDREFAALAMRLNLDLDLRLTATERIHAFFRPFDRNGRFSSHEFGAAEDGGRMRLDGNPEALFFEGDLGAITAGLSGKESRFDLPFTFGLIPLLFQNGVWMEDAITGFAFSIPARNSRLLDIANFDVTFFAGFDRVDSPAFTDLSAGGRLRDSDVNVYGVAAFLDILQGYVEIGYAFVDGRNELDDLDYHNFSAAYTRRWFDRVSNSLRVVVNAGQDRPGAETANGALFLIENSWVTSQPYTLVPYGNFFVGLDRPQSVARDPGAGGVLKNTGILFETDGLTGFPTLDASGADVWGAAIGLNYLFDLNQQLVVEAAMVQIIGDRNKPGRPAAGDQFGLGVRYQRPLNHWLILRADAMVGWQDADRDNDLIGARLELRAKF